MCSKTQCDTCEDAGGETSFKLDVKAVHIWSVEIGLCVLTVWLLTVSQVVDDEKNINTCIEMKLFIDSLIHFTSLVFCVMNYHILSSTFLVRQNRSIILETLVAS